MGVTMKQTNPGFLAALKKRMLGTKGKVTVGFPYDGGLGQPHYPTGMQARRRNKRKRAKTSPVVPGGGPSIAQVAAWNNETRPFFDTAVSVIHKKWREIMHKAVPGINAGTVAPEKVLNTGGVMGQREIQKSIRDGNWAANSEATEKIKGSAKPLIDSGDMSKAPTFIVEI